MEDLAEEEVEDFDDMEDLNMYDLMDDQQAEDDVSEMETEMLDCVWERERRAFLISSSKKEEFEDGIIV